MNSIIVWKHFNIQIKAKTFLCVEIINSEIILKIAWWLDGCSIHYGAKKFRISFRQFDKSISLRFVITPETTFQPKLYYLFVKSWCHSMNESLKMRNDSDIKHSSCVFFSLLFSVFYLIGTFNFLHVVALPTKNIRNLYVILGNQVTFVNSIQLG